MTATEKALQRQVDQLRSALITTLIWIGSSANSPLSEREIQILVAKAEGSKEEYYDD